MYLGWLSLLYTTWPREQRPYTDRTEAARANTRCLNPPHTRWRLFVSGAILHLNLTDSPLAGDLLLVGVPQLHFPAEAGVVDARERLQGLRHVLVEQGGGRSLLRVRALHASAIPLRQLRC